MPAGVEPLSSRQLSGYIFNMTVTVLLFASYADLLGTNQLSLDLSPGATAGDALGQVQTLAGCRPASDAIRSSR